MGVSSLGMQTSINIENHNFLWRCPSLAFHLPHDRPISRQISGWCEFRDRGISRGRTAVFRDLSSSVPLPPPEESGVEGTRQPASRLAPRSTVRIDREVSHSPRRVTQQNRRVVLARVVLSMFRALRKGSVEQVSLSSGGRKLPDSLARGLGRGITEGHIVGGHLSEVRFLKVRLVADI